MLLALNHDVEIWPLFPLRQEGNLAWVLRVLVAGFRPFSCRFSACQV